MRAFLYLIMIVMLAAASSAEASSRKRSDALFNFGFSQDTIRGLLSPQNLTPDLDKNSLLDLYYENCRSLNQSPDLQSHVDLQCACTAAKMADVMTLEQIEAIPDNSFEGNYQGARMLSLAYIPCLQSAVHNITYDGCLYDNPGANRLRHPRKVCSCLAESLAQYVGENGERMIPGFRRNRFSKNMSVANPLAYIIDSRTFEVQTKGFLSSCMIRYEYGQ